MFRNLRTLLMCVSLCLTLSVRAQPAIQAVVFDTVDVMIAIDREQIVTFMMDTLHISRKDVQNFFLDLNSCIENEGDELQFWSDFVMDRGIAVPEEWLTQLIELVKTGAHDVPGVLAIAEQLRSQGYRTPILSNTHALGARAMSEMGCYDSFDPVVLSCNTKVLKPNVEAYVVLLEMLDLPPSACVFIDDRLDNVQTAASLGMHAIHFTDSQALIAELMCLGIDLSAPAPVVT